MARIYINRHIVAANQKTGDRNAPITIMRRGRRVSATEVEMIGTCRVVYSPDKPLKSGARVWIECDEPFCHIVKRKPETPA
jgi:hypothetical protein